MTEQYVIGGFMAVLGAIVGSFLNVCIVRMPQEKSVVTPRSHCVRCQKMIPWYDNIPVLSYLILRGRCRYCRAPISFRYVLVELITAATFVIFYWFFGLTPVMGAYLLMASGFIVAVFVDFGHRIIPDEISVGGMCAGILLSLLFPALHGYAAGPGAGWLPYAQSLGQSLLGAFVGGALLYAMGLLGDVIFKKETMGGGDVKLLAMIGAFLGWKMALLTFWLAPVFGAVYGIIEKIRTKDNTMAYGPFLVLGALISLFAGERIIDWWWNLYKIY